MDGRKEEVEKEMWRLQLKLNAFTGLNPPSSKSYHSECSSPPKAVLSLPKVSIAAQTESHEVQLEESNVSAKHEPV